MTSTENNQLTVLILTMSLYPSPMGGAEIQALRLAKELKKKGFDIWFLTLAQKGQLKEELVEGINVFRIRLFFSPFFYSKEKNRNEKNVQVEYAKNLRENFEIGGKKSPLGFINYFVFFWNAYFFVRKKRIKLLYVPMVEWLAFVATMIGKATNIKVVIKDSTMNGLANLLRYSFGRQMRSAICKNGYFVAMTRVIRASFIEAGIEESKIFQIPNGIEFPPVSKRSVIRNKFIFVGNLSQQPAKGVDILLKAWKMVLVDIPDAQLFIIGDGNLISYLEYVDKLDISGNVHFLGKQSKFQSHLVESMAFILPSRREGMSNALLEAMALGVTCIATDISGNQDLIRHKVNGLLIPTENEAALVDAVKYVYNNQEEAIAMGVEARKTIENGYTLDIVAKEYERVFRSL